MQKRNDGPTLKVSFIGGVGEIGKNMTALECDDEIIVIDCGSSFPGGDMPGIDLVIPDVSYLIANREKVKGIVLTHGHEDHIGALPYVLKDLNVPVFGTKLTLALVDNKLREQKLDGISLNVVKPGSVISLGTKFKVEFVNVSHSIAGSCALAVTTPIGLVFHTGDFKVDYTPIDGNVINLKRIAEIGGKGVTLLLAESTNVEREGSSMSEAKVGESIAHILNENQDRRIFIATFASNIHRLQQIVDLAKKFKRKVAFAGRSMVNVVECATKIGELKLDSSCVVDIDMIDKEEDKKLIIITTGSQGEPMSALTRIAAGEFPKIQLGYNDTVIISASPIPGNEKMVYNVVNNIYQHGARAIYERLAEVHASGHACQDELKLIHALIKPKYFIPVHGEYRHLKRHAQLAVELGMRESSILLPDIGNCVELSRTGMQFGESVSSGSRLVDGASLEDRENSIVMKDRKHLSEDGIFVISACVSERSGDLLSDPVVVNRGFVMPENADYLSDIKQIVVNCAGQTDVRADVGNTEFAAAIKKAVKNFIYKKTKQNPVVMALITRV